MASNQSQGANGGGGDGTVRRGTPEWADGLKQLYDSVVEEALPDSFKDLLDRLEGANDAGGERPAGRQDTGQ